MSNIQIDTKILLKIKVTQQTAVLEHFFSKNKQIFRDLRDNSFSVPQKRDFSSTMMKKSISISTADTDCSTEEESIESPQKVTHIKNEEFIHYSNILPASDKKTVAINTLIGIFYNFLL